MNNNNRTGGKSQDATPLQHALDRLAEGIFPVIPLHYVTMGACSCSAGSDCTHTGKHPIWKNYHARALTSREAVQRVWEEAPYNIGGLVPAGYVVLDCDPKNDGVRTLGILEKKFRRLAPAPTDHTPSGGFHMVFRIGSPRLARKRHFDIGPGLELLSIGHVVVLAGSEEKNGTRWAASPQLTLENTPVPLLPRWVEMEALLPRERQTVQAPKIRQHEKLWPTEDADRVLPTPVKHLPVAGPLRLPATIPYGQRHTVLLAYAGRLRFQGGDADAISRAVWGANRERCDRPFQTPAEVLELQELVEFIVAKPKGAGRPLQEWEEAQEFLPRFREAIRQTEWSGIAGKSDQAVALALFKIAERVGSLEIGASVREIGELAGVSRYTAQRALKNLRQIGYIRLIFLCTLFSNSNIYRLLLPHCAQATSPPPTPL